MDEKKISEYINLRIAQLYDERDILKRNAKRLRSIAEEVINGLTLEAAFSSNQAFFAEQDISHLARCANDFNNRYKKYLFIKSELSQLCYTIGGDCLKQFQDKFE